MQSSSAGNMNDFEFFIPREMEKKTIEGFEQSDLI